MITPSGSKTDLADKIRTETNENVFSCYQCGKCTSSCPVAEHFDLAPNQVLRALQLGLDEVALKAKTPWLCAGCETCTTRCPNGIDVARVMDFLAAEGKARGIAPAVPEVALFNQIFLRNARLLGRTYELGLTAELNVRSGHPLKDWRLALEMIRKRKLKLMPEFVRRPRPVEPLERRPNRIAYYPGCSLHGVASEYDYSVRAVANAIDLELVEPEGWQCCGASPAHRTDERLAASMPLANLALIAQMGMDEVTMPCAACFGRHKGAQYAVARRPELKAELAGEIGFAAEPPVKVRALLDTMVDRVGLNTIAQRVSRPLVGLKVACYYGCLLTRPVAVTGAKDHEYPMTMDRLTRTLGATPVDWSAKTSCCGGTLSLTQTDIALDMTRKILTNALAAGADVMAVACPMCHANLDGRQRQLALGPQPDGSSEIPILYFTQLMALAFGLDEKAAALAKNMVDPRPRLGALT
jgi:heterodisulfide reductase subunit B2